MRSRLLSTGHPQRSMTGPNGFPEEVETSLGGFEVAMETLEVRPLIVVAAEIGPAGAFETLDRYGEHTSIGALCDPRMRLVNTVKSTAVNM